MRLFLDRETRPDLRGTLLSAGGGVNDKETSWFLEKGAGPPGGGAAQGRSAPTHTAQVPARPKGVNCRLKPPTVRCYDIHLPYLPVTVFTDIGMI